jgi:hypothetical protein
MLSEVDYNRLCELLKKPDKTPDEWEELAELNPTKVYPTNDKPTTPTDE